MPRQLQWAIGGLALLIVGFIVGIVAFQIYLHVDLKNFKEELASPDPKTETETEQPPEQVEVPEVDNRPPHPDDGRKYEWHGDHWLEVPIDVQQADQPVQKDKPIQLLEPKTTRINPSEINVPRAKYEDFKHVLKDPEGTLRKNAAIMVADYRSPESYRALAELNHLENAIAQGYIGGSMWSDEAKKLRDLMEEVYWKPLEAAGHIVRVPVPKVRGIKKYRELYGESGENR